MFLCVSNEYLSDSLTLESEQIMRVCDLRKYSWQVPDSIFFSANMD